MDHDDCLRVLMELERASGRHISGRLALDGHVREFSGWLSFMALLEGLRADAGGSRAPPAAEADPLDAAGPAGHTARLAPLDPQDQPHNNHQEG